ncbi:FtsX-like permease family protein [Solwaraspora sp. WMMB335]|uniref:FtsX-like permease family protein n=1 Tax=Solwaraspora sp. WMMB335 TaxID=3404118 RepID=UPI003B94BBCC
MNVESTPRRGIPARWMTEMALGLRLSVAGGRSGWVRLAMIAAGIGLGVAMLLLAAALPALTAARGDRLVARAEDPWQKPTKGADTLLITEADSRYRQETIHGRLVQPEGNRAPLPPGVARQLAPGEMVVSPALARLLDSDDGELLRQRWDGHVVGTIGPQGLFGPAEYAFYLGTDRLTEDSAIRLRSFGRADLDGASDPVLLLLGVVGLAVLLVPVVVFVATAVRFGGEARDRQLAALRLVGADAAMTRRIAAGETLAGAVLGLAVGGLLYAAAGLLAQRTVPRGMSFYLADLRPVPVLAALVVILVPGISVLVTLSSLRRVVVEPLGVVRRGGHHHRRLWWRLILPVAGLALLYPIYDGLSERDDGFEIQVLAGLTALLVGVALLLPWLVEAAVRRLGGGSVAWQLAVRRLQLDSGTAVRAVSGIAVSVAGVIALQGLLAAVQAQYTPDPGRDIEQFQATVRPRSFEPESQWTAALSQAASVDAVDTLTMIAATPAGSEPATTIQLQVGDCAVLRLLARLDSCADGDTFLIDDADAASAGGAGAALPGPGTSLLLGALDGGGEQAPRWTLPEDTRTVVAWPGDLAWEPRILTTPAALRVAPPAVNTDFYVALDTTDADAIERLRNAAADVNPTALVAPVEQRVIVTTLADIRQALLVGVVALLVLIGASMLVNVAEQLRERRRLLAVLVAFGTRRNTLTRSVLYQITIPVALGLALAVAAGSGLAALLQTAADAPVRFDWSGIGATAGAAALVVVATTVASLPLLGRLARPTGLRSE